MKTRTRVARRECGCPQDTLHVPVTQPAKFCDAITLTSGPCERPQGHHGRHLAYWLHCGRVRSVWGVAREITQKLATK